MGRVGFRVRTKFLDRNVISGSTKCVDPRTLANLAKSR